MQPGVEIAVKAITGPAWSVDGVTRPGAYLVSQVGGRPAFGGTPSDVSVLHLIAELKARGLKITFYPFVVMDIPSGNALPDPWTGASSQPAYPWRGRITCDPAPGQPGSPQGTSAAAAQVAEFFSGGRWNYRRMILHYAGLLASAGGVDAFLIGSELRALTRVRSGAGRVSGGRCAGDAGGGCEGDRRLVHGGYLRRRLDRIWRRLVDARSCAFRWILVGIGAIGAVGIDYYAPLADWRDEAGHRDRAVASSTYDLGYLGGNVGAGEGFDWYYADDAARGRRPAPISPTAWETVGVPAQGHLELVVELHYERVAHAELVTPTAWIPRSKPVWFTEVGCPAVDKGANQPSVFPDPKSSENHLPYFSSGARDDLMQRRMLEAFIGGFDPAFGADDAHNPVSPLYGGRMVDVSAIHLWTWDARPYPVFPAATDIWSDGPNWQTGHWLTGRLGAARSMRWSARCSTMPA